MDLCGVREALLFRASEMGLESLIQELLGRLCAAGMWRWIDSLTWKTRLSASSLITTTSSGRSDSSVT